MLILAVKKNHNQPLLECFCEQFNGELEEWGFLFPLCSPCWGTDEWLPAAEAPAYCAVSADENSNQSSLSDVYQLKVDSSPNSSPSPQQSESMSPAHTSDFRTDDSQPPTLGQETLEEPSLPSSEVADEPPTLTKEEPVPLETQVTEEEEDSGAPPLKRFCADQNSVCHTASES
ncbi:B-cell CLL/lymphoma 7 protein family member B [Anas platyrhynchos]|uniref:B-cell CLL/lymphoma 7 protein family member B n=1 Tax=Anas platyrhynchos TaxID=8839 RepID=R0LQK6_ANAPL|nr:B-cell CLL/lymphoma 7 protein family member B [Anas platyrhynchos]